MTPSWQKRACGQHRMGAEIPVKGLQVQAYYQKHFYCGQDILGEGQGAVNSLDSHKWL